MKKILAVLTLLMTLLLFTACLGGDKIAGQWIGRTSSLLDMSGGRKVDDIMVCEIRKNGDSYVMDYHYLVLRNNEWSERYGQKGLGVTLNGNLITVLLPGVNFNMTYIEKDKTIQVPPMGLHTQTIVVERDDDGKKLEALKTELSNEYQEKYGNKK